MHGGKYVAHFTTVHVRVNMPHTKCSFIGYTCYNCYKCHNIFLKKTEVIRNCNTKLELRFKQNIYIMLKIVKQNLSYQFQKYLGNVTRCVDASSSATKSRISLAFIDVHTDLHQWGRLKTFQNRFEKDLSFWEYWPIW